MSGDVALVCQASELRRDRAWPVADVRVSKRVAAYESKWVLCWWVVLRGMGVQGRVCEVHCINFLSTTYEGGNDRTKSPEPRWVFDVTPCEDGIKAKQLTLWEGESADLLFVAPQGH